MKRVGWFYSPIFLEHDSGPGHPESPQRLVAIQRAIGADPVGRSVERIADFTRRAPGSLKSIHDESYITWVEKAISGGARALDYGDTGVGPRSYEAALAAADAAVEAAQMVWDGRVDRAFVAPRPPGHHAERNRAMGFCIFNNIAVAAAWILDRGAARVAIVDWDVHHGNGTQSAFYAEPRVLFISLHQQPLYPGSGSRDETGEGDAEGTTVNIPMRPGSGDEEYLNAFDQTVIPALDDFKPEMILVSAGFDGHVADPLAAVSLSTAAYGEMTRSLCDASRRLCGGKLVSILEGGYNLSALSEVVPLHLRVMAEIVD